VRYSRDPVDVELVQDAWETIRQQSGDCDDKVTLLASLLAVQGFTPRFVVGGMEPDVLDHVWCEVYLDWCDQWLPLDPTNEQAWPGWYQPFPYIYTFDIWQEESCNILLIAALVAWLTLHG
jgi:transglutaminase-like putative cysteine protease